MPEFLQGAFQSNHLCRKFVVLMSQLYEKKKGPVKELPEPMTISITERWVDLRSF
jgi:hypothetical protein